MDTLRLAAAALNLTPLDWTTNRRAIIAALDAAREADAGIVCLPEMCISGYGCEDMFLSADVAETALELLGELLPATRGLIAPLGLPIHSGGHVYNAVALCCDGRVLGFVPKQHLAGDGIHYEPRWFRPWPAGECNTFEWRSESYPLGDLLFDCGGVRIGIEICRDAWGEIRPGRSLAARGAEIILNPSASHFAFAKQDIREGFVLAGSHEFAVGYAYANVLGNEAGRAIYDGGILIAQNGEMLLRGPRFSFADVVLATVPIDLAAIRRSKGTVTRSEGKTVTVPFAWPEVEATGPTRVLRSLLSDGPASNSAAITIVEGDVPGHPEWETGPYRKEEEFARAVPLALFDYLRKSHTAGFVVSLSGGADSSSVAVLVHLMVKLALIEIGPAALSARLPQTDGLDELAENQPAADAQSAAAAPPAADALSQKFVRRLLCCVYQATRNSSRQTRDAAQQVAAAVGAEFIEWNVDATIEDYVQTVSQAVGRPLVWDRDDVSLQNIQARARAPGVWLLANLKNALLLATSNRSEAAVGYSTMDGDTCGGLAPIAGIDKAFLRDWLRWMEQRGPAGIGPLPALAVVNRLEPTAELRPPEAGQTDEGDLMPYDMLDVIERLAIRDKLSPLAVFRALSGRLPEHSPQQLAAWIERFFTLWCHNQWKRERYAPSFHLDDENLDPKTWCRFPILSGGYERELAKLREEVRK